MSMTNVSQASSKGSKNSRNTPRYIIKGSMSSKIYITNLTYTSSSLTLQLSQQSTTIVNNISVSNVNSFGFARIEGTENTTLSNWNINSNINNDTVYIVDSIVDSINEMSISNIGGSKFIKNKNFKVAIHSTRSQINQIDSINWTGIQTSVIYFEDSVVLVSNWYFSSNGKISNNRNSRMIKLILNLIFYYFEFSSRIFISKSWLFVPCNTAK